MPYENPGLDDLRRMLTEAKTIAMVGASSNPERTSNGIMKRLQSGGFKVIPVNPRESEVNGEKAYPSLAEVPVPIDIVNVFRRSEETPAIAAEAVAVKAKALWLQLGVTNEEAAETAKAGGLEVVMDRCIGHTLMELGIPARQSK